MPKQEKKILALFGSTGSIGCCTLDVVREHPDHFEVRYLAANSNVELLASQVDEFKPRAVCLVDADACSLMKDRALTNTEVLGGLEGLLEMAARDDYSTMVGAFVGFAGLVPTIAAIETGKDIALANKETLVVAGDMISKLVRRHRVSLLPIDSEHSAIHQCLAGEDKNSVSKIILTASGGPFRGKSREELARVTRAEALRHPNWKMGNKITIDSATLMNKGLEVIEAHWLFDVDPSRIEIVVHPQSIIHSMVEFVDGSMKAQLGMPDMKLPIQYALAYATRFPSSYPRLDLRALPTLTFEVPDKKTFPCLRLAYDVLAAGGSAPTLLNAANEIAVGAFLDDRIAFLEIPEHIEDCLNGIPAVRLDSIETIIDADFRAREFVRKKIRLKNT